MADENRKGRLFFINPNKIQSLDTYEDSSRDNVPVNLEDLSLGVNLTVIVPDRDSCGQSEQYNISWSVPENKDISFMEGNDGFLSDNYITLTYKDIVKQGKDAKESLGISSINVTYNSYFYPEITIEFVDVRGNSLMIPNEVNYENKVKSAYEKNTGEVQEYKPTQENFFSALFSFPYPTFYLTIKGFYGRPVQYQLAVSDFRSRFNSNTGNFDATVKFIGYMYGVYSDIPMTYLMAAPYCNYGGKNLWNELDLELESGFPMPTLVDLVKKIKYSKNELKKNVDENLKREYNSLNNMYNELNNILSNYKMLIKCFNKKDTEHRNGVENVDFIEKGNGIYLFLKSDDSYDNSSDISWWDIHLDENIRRKLIDSITNFNKRYSENIPFPNDDNDITSKPMKSSEEKFTLYIDYRETKEKLSSKDVILGYDRSYLKYFGVENSNFSNGYKDAEGYKCIYLCEIEDKAPLLVKSLLSDLNRIKNGGFSFYYKFYNSGNFEKIVEDKLSDITKRIDAIKKDFESTYRDNLIAVLGFVPSIKNITKIVMGHMQTFMGLMDVCARKIKNSGSERNASEMGININSTDIKTNGSENTFVSPFPLVKDSNTNEIVYPKNVAGMEDMEELKLIEKMLEGTQITVRAKNAADAITDNGDNDTFIPSNISDLITIKNPYSNVLTGIYKDSGTERLMEIFAIRLINNFCFEDYTRVSLKTYGETEAYNVWKGNRDINIPILNQIKSEDFNSSYFREFITNDIPALNQKIYDGGPKFSENSLFPSVAINESEIKNQFKENNGLSYNKVSIDVFESYEGKLSKIGKKTIYARTPNKLVKLYNDYEYYNNWNKKILEETDSKLNIEDKKIYLDKYLNITEENRSRVILSNSQIDFTKTNSKNSKECKYFLIKDMNPSSVLNGDQIETDTKDIGKVDADDIFFGYNGEVHLRNIYIKGTNISYFNSQPYVLQNESEDSIENIDMAKAFMFLQCFSYNDKQLKELLVNGRNVIKLPELFLLYIGSQIYEMKNGIKFVYKDKALEYREENTVDETYKDYSDKYRILSFKYDIKKNVSYLKKEGSDIAQLIAKVFYPNGEDIFNLSSMFKNWATNGFRKIKDILELKGKKDGFEFNSLMGLNRLCQYFYLPNENTIIYDEKDSFRSRRKNIVVNEDKVYKVQLKKLLNISPIGKAKDFDKNWLIKPILNENGEIDYNKYYTLFDLLDAVCEDDIFEVYDTMICSKYGISMYINTNSGKGVTVSNEIVKLLENKYLFISPSVNELVWKDVPEKVIRHTGNTGVSGNENDKIEIKASDYSYIVCSTDKFNAQNTINNCNITSLEAAFDAFKAKIVELYKGVDPNDLTENETMGDFNASEDSKLSMYLTLKNIYDRWLCGTDKKKWYIEKPNSEFQRFHFIDSFYNNIGDNFLIDGQQIIDIINIIMRKDIYNTQDINDMSLYSFMSLLCQKNNLLFLALPVFFGESDHMIESVRKMFTPIPYLKSLEENDIMGPSYICLYPHKPSEHLDIKGAKYTDDGFNLTDPYKSGYDMSGTVDYDGDTEIEDVNYPSDLADDSSSYSIPSFGVDFAQQNQHIFKNISVSMDNPQVTEYSIGAQFNIANMNGENVRQVNFEGQDLYRVYSNHSYTCTVEMMGCSQIMPLMYFQLNNIPMFHGAYMIIKVEHNIVPGNMTTKFTGVRLNKNKIPMIKQGIDIKGILEGYTGFPGDDGSSSYDEMPNLTDEPKFTIPDDDYTYEKITHDENISIGFDNFSSYKDGGHKEEAYNRLNKYLRKCVYEIALYVSENEEMKLYVTSCTRNNGKCSDHSVPVKDKGPLRGDIPGKRIKNNLGYQGCAIDLQVRRISNGVRDSESEVKLFNYICTNYAKNIRQLIWEDKTGRPVTDNNISNCIHFATYGEGSMNDKTNIFVAENINGAFNSEPAYTSSAKEINNINNPIPNNLPKAFIKIIKNTIDKNNDLSFSIFTNFYNFGYKITKELLDKWCENL